MKEIKMKIYRMPLKSTNDEGEEVTLKVPLPVYSTPDAACFDIYTANTEAIVVEPRQTVKVSAGIKVEIEKGYQLKLHNRSGLGSNKNVQLAHCVGTVDADYRGEIFIPIHNRGNSCFVIDPLMRICQGEITEAPQYEFIEVSEESELSSTTRGSGAFGSTGTK